MKDKIYVGIDPGLKGGICAIINTNLETNVMPLTSDGELDTIAIQNILRSYCNIYEKVHVCIEDVHSIFGASAKSNFQFGKGCGKIEAIVECNQIPYSKVPPKTWQKEMWAGVKKSENNKLTSLAAARRLFPDVNFKASSRCTKEHDGMVDAALICEWGRRKNL